MSAQHASDLRPSQREVLRLFERFGGLDDRELVSCARYCGLTQSESSLRSRRAELVRRRLIRKDDSFLGPTAGRSRAVWVLVEHCDG